MKIQSHKTKGCIFEIIGEEPFLSAGQKGGGFIWAILTHQASDGIWHPLVAGIIPCS